MWRTFKPIYKFSYQKNNKFEKKNGKKGNKINFPTPSYFWCPLKTCQLQFVSFF